MIKYIICILCSVLLAGGSILISSIDQQELRAEKVGDINVQSFPSYDCNVSMVVNDHISKDNHTFSDGITFYNINDGLLGSISTLRNSIPSKILKFNATNVVMLILSSMDSPLPDNKSRDTSTNTNFAKYSCGYYVYTLEHILL